MPPATAVPTVSSDYTISVENFGPIAEATVDLRPLTVLIGPSNTGKSYFAGLLYALHRSLGTPPTMRRGPFFHMSRHIKFPRTKDLSEELDQDIQHWVSTCSKLKEKEETPPLPDSVVKKIKQILRDFQGFGDALIPQVARCFGVDDPEVLARKSSGSAAASLDLFISLGKNEHTRFHASLKRQQAECSTDLDVHEVKFIASEIIEIIDDSTFFHIEEDIVRHEELQTSYILDQLIQLVIRKAFSPLIRRTAYFLPADRTGVMHSHHVVVSALVQRASLAGIRQFDDVPMLSGVMADFLDLLVSHISQLEKHPRKSTRVRELAKDMEQRVLDGKIEVRPGEVQYPSFAYRPTGWKKDLPLMRASSMVSELAPIVLYLRHVVRRNDVLIIEEPESHLHPAKQAALARELAKIVNEGVRVVVTTHSEWILEQIGNLVKASELPPDRRKEAKVVLKPEDIGAWLFEREAESQGSVVKEVKIDPETGLYPTDFGSVSDALYNESAEIYNLLQDGVR